MGGVEKSNIYQYFNILYGLGNNCFLVGGCSEDKGFGAVKCVFEFSSMIRIMQLLG